MTQANRKRVETYKNATTTSLYQLYTNFSQKKADALEEIKSQISKMGGHDLKVFNGCKMNYSAAFITDNKLYYYTFKNCYVIPLEE